MTTVSGKCKHTCIALSQLIQQGLTTLDTDPAIAMSADDLVMVDNTVGMFSDITNDAILSQVTDQPDTITTDTDNEAIPELMPTKSEVEGALAVILCTTEGRLRRDLGRT